MQVAHVTTVELLIRDPPGLGQSPNKGHSFPIAIDLRDESNLSTEDKMTGPQSVVCRKVPRYKLSIS